MGSLPKNYKEKKELLLREFRAILQHRKKGDTVGLGKKTSNLFRVEKQSRRHKLDVTGFNRVIRIDRKKLLAEVEGMTTYEDLVDETLKFGLMPAVVPELKSITAGGATTGLGIESSSFKYGFVHETIEEIEILCGNGKTVVATKNNEHQELFFGFPNSYGSFGYALKLKVKLVRVKPFVKLHHLFYNDDGEFFKDIGILGQRARMHGGIDFIDGTVFERGKNYLTFATMTDKAPHLSDYKFMNIYYRSIAAKENDYLTIKDYIWRWDFDWFWCSKHFGVQNPLVRFLFGKFCLKSTFYWKLRRLTNRFKIPQMLSKIQGRRYEDIIQDVQIPLEHAQKFLHFFQKEIGIKPVWICPIQNYDPAWKFGLYPTDAQKFYINFGFWDAKLTTHENGYYNRMIEAKVEELQGKKSLYSDSYYSPQKFWELYNRESYVKLKAKYDPEGVFGDLYAKCVRR